MKDISQIVNYKWVNYKFHKNWASFGDISVFVFNGMIMQTCF